MSTSADAPLSDSNPTRPLDGVLVVAIEQALAAPLATCRLADAGARVIKVERVSGDFARQYDSAAGGISAYFAWANRGKESLVADIKNAEDRALLERILMKADVFVQNLAPGAAQRAGLGSEELRRLNPRLITCDITGYGSRGPYRHRKAYDLLIQAESGLASITGSPDQPGRVGVSVCDVATGMNANAAILEALIARGRTGVGCRIEVSLFDSLADWMATPLLGWDYSKRPWQRIGLAHPTIAPYGVFELRTGEPVLVAVQNDAEFRRLMLHLLEDESLADDVRFRDNTARVANRGEVDSMVGDRLRRHDRESASAILERADLAYGFVNDLAALSQHPQLRRIDVASARGLLSMPAPPARIDGRDFQAGPIPDLDQHGAAIRREFAPRAGEPTG